MFFRQFCQFPGIWEVPGPEIRILRKIASPELVGNLGKNMIFRIFRNSSGIFPGKYPEMSRKIPGNFPEISGKFPGNFLEHSKSLSETFREISGLPKRELSRNYDISSRFWGGNFS